MELYGYAEQFTYSPTREDARARHAARAAAQGIVEDHSLFLPAAWRSEEGVRICDGVVSVRNPDGHRPLPVAETRRISDALRY
jgi:hypothetical protein